MPSRTRPLSPHLQVYRPQLTSMLSIVHRLCGVALAISTPALVYWLVAAAAGPESFATAQGLVGSFIGRLALFGWTFALFYHMCNGIRHLCWDLGYGFDITTTYRSGWLMLAASITFTLVSWILGYSLMGAS